MVVAAVAAAASVAADALHAYVCDYNALVCCMFLFPVVFSVCFRLASRSAGYIIHGRAAVL